MKRSWSCPKCQSTRIGYFENMVDRAPSGQDDKKHIGWESSELALGMKALKPCGEVEAFVCTDCGYYEEYVKNARQIPWDKMRGFRWCVRKG